MGTELTCSKIRAVGFPQMPAREWNVSEELYEQLRLAKALNQEMTRVTDASFSRPEGGSNNLERVLLPKFEGQPETWADFRSGFKAILGMCEPALEMVCLRNAMPEAATRFIMGVTKPAEA